MRLSDHPLFAAQVAPPCRNECGVNLVRMPATAETDASSSLNFSVEMLNSGVPGAAGCNEVIYLLKDLTRHGPDPSFLKYVCF